MTTTFTVYCRACFGSKCMEVEYPEGWIRGTEISYLDAYCPEHRAMGEFLSDQCVGCVSSWDDCNLRQKWENRKKLTNEEDDTLRRGRCPVRINGSTMARIRDGKAESISEVDVSSTNLVGGEMIADLFEERHFENLEY